MSVVNDLLNVNIEDWKVFLFILILLIFAIPTLSEQIKKFFNTVGIVSTRETRNSEYERRIDKIENDVVNLHNDIKELNQGVGKITEMLGEHIQQDKQEKVAILRNMLWEIYKESKEQNYITKEGLKTFLELGKVYEECGGDDIYHDKLHPQVIGLDVKE